MKKITYTLYPSSCVEQYFAHKCERLVLYKGLNKEGKKETGFDTEASGQGSEVAAMAGYEWEKSVAKKLAKEGKLIYAPGNEPGTFGSFDETQTIDALAQAVSDVQKDHICRYLFQGSLAVTDAFKEKHFRFNKALYDGTDEHLQIEVSKTHPDLIRVAWDEERDTVILSVVDIKLAHRMKIEHKMQVTLYTRLLRYVLEQRPEINALADDRYGYLWNKNHEYEQIIHYLEKLHIKVDELGNVITVHNGIVDAIINQYYVKAAQQGIHMVVKGRFPSDCEIDAFDICTIFSNILSNALEAASETEEKYVSIECRYTEKNIIIVVQNSFCIQKQDTGRWLKTQKENSDNHGFGLENMKDSVSKYNGIFDIETNNNIFTLTILFGRAGKDSYEHCNCG